MTFPKYPEYKDSGVEWLGEVPAHWEVLKIKRICHLQSGEFISPDQIIEEGDFPVYGGNGKRGYASHYTHEGLHPIVGRQGALCGNINYATGRFWASEHAVVARTENGVHPFWLGELLRSMDLNQYSVSAAQPGLAVDRIRNLMTGLPPTEEQEVIAAFLDHETGKIDALIEEQRRLIELLKEKRQAVISHTVTKGLDPNVPMKDSGVEWLGEVPAHWAVAALRWYATVQGGVAKGKKYGPDEPVVLRPYLRVANVQDGHLDLSEVYDVPVSLTELNRYELREGDVLMNEGGDSDKLGRGAVWQGQIEGCLHQNHVFAIRPSRGLSANWLSMFTRSDSARAYFYLYSKQSTNLASISSRNVMSCLVPIPSPKEQSEILEQLSEALVRIDELVSKTDRAIALLLERRSALISAAVTGKIDVRAWSRGSEAEKPGLAMVAEASAGYSAQGGAQ
ncbi:restriction endonuclease subunit S [Thioalkalivibrio sp. ALJ15]|uniref:restriction endonuclease subunit S n=1 Tax=Thioalkalivibrio sp. ALJ15 TaxID=748652 RepID=UPI00036AE3AB|nr:restriction endonuclease subunit S [Thioalkalivibrio sp. ALJ15]